LLLHTFLLRGFGCNVPNTVISPNTHQLTVIMLRLSHLLLVNSCVSRQTVYYWCNSVQQHRQPTTILTGGTGRDEFYPRLLWQSSLSTQGIMMDKLKTKDANVVNAAWLTLTQCPGNNDVVPALQQPDWRTVLLYLGWSMQVPRLDTELYSWLQSSQTLSIHFFFGLFLVHLPCSTCSCIA